MTRKLSEIILELAMQGLKHEKYAHSDVVHALVFLAHVAWNRDTKSPDYLENSYRSQLGKFPVSRSAIKRELITDDWDDILEKMLNYKKSLFPDDKRIITVCGYTSRETFRLEWE